MKSKMAEEMSVVITHMDKIFALFITETQKNGRMKCQLKVKFFENIRFI